MKKLTKKSTWIGFGIALGLVALLIGGLAVVAQTETQPASSEGYDPFVIAAETLGMTEDELDEFLDDGVSLAQLARERGIDPDAIVHAIVQADEAEIEQALAEGEIDEIEAVEWQDYGYVFAVEFVYLPIDEWFWDVLDELEDWEEFEEWDDCDLFGYEEFDDYAYLPFGMVIDSQREMAYSLLDSGVEPEIVVDAVIDSEASLFAQILDFVLYEVLGFEDDELWEDEVIETVAEELGLSEDDVWIALDEGRTLAELAQAHGVDPQVLIDALMVEEEEWIAELLEDGELTEEEAAEWRTDSLEMIEELVYEPWF